MTTSNVPNLDLEVKSTSHKKKHNAEEYSVRPCTETTSTGKTCHVEEIAELWTDAPRSAHVTNLGSSPRAVYNVTQGQTRYYYITIGSGVNRLEVVLNWGVVTNSLALTIYDPSRTNWGTYHDNSDGIVDGKIHLSIYPKSGETYVKQGQWTFPVKGESVSGTQSFTITFITH